MRPSALLTALLAANPPQALPQATLAVRAAIAREAATAPPGACVSPRLARDFVSTRMLLPANTPVPRHRAVAAFRWARADAAPGEAAEVDPEAARQLNRSLTRALAQPLRSASRLRPADVPGPLRLSAVKCRWTLFFSSPVVLDDTAFVEVSSVCPGLCGGSWLLALHRFDGTWKAAALTGLFVS